MKRSVGEGFAEVTGDRVSILTDMAALEAEIDEAKAEEALKAAEDRLKGESLSDEQVMFFHASALRRIGPGGGDASEDIEVHEVPLDSVPVFLAVREAKGCLVDPKVWAGLYFAHIRL